MHAHVLRGSWHQAVKYSAHMDAVCVYVCVRVLLS